MCAQIDLHSGYVTDVTNAPDFGMMKSTVSLVLVNVVIAVLLDAFGKVRICYVICSIQMLCPR